MYYRTYTCISNLIHVIQNLYLSYGTHTGLMEHILILRILSLCEGTCRYDKSELIIIVSHTGSDQTYTDTYTYFTDTRVPLGPTRLILILPIREYP